LAMQQEMVKFADAPYCHGIAILLGTGSSWNTQIQCGQKEKTERHGKGTGLWPWRF
jgi:hypothetical protein